MIDTVLETNTIVSRMPPARILQMTARCLASLRFIDETKFIQENHDSIVRWVRTFLYSESEGHMTGYAVSLAVILQMQGRYLGDSPEIANRLAFIASYSALACVAFDLFTPPEDELNQTERSEQDGVCVHCGGAGCEACMCDAGDENNEKTLVVDRESNLVAPQDPPSESEVRADQENTASESGEHGVSASS